MGETSQSLIFPTKANIVQLNVAHLNRSGGNVSGAGKMINENSLDWVLDAIQNPIFGKDQYPTISQKAAVLAWTIINNHVFIDGNKRTGMSALMIFLEINGFFLKARDNEIIATAIKVANPTESSYSREAFMGWVSRKLDLLM